jgi:hypothetical protein
MPPARPNYGLRWNDVGTTRSSRSNNSSHVMKALNQNGSTSIYSSRPFPRAAHRDPWPSHAIALIDYGITGNVLGKWTWLIIFELSDHVQWNYCFAFNQTRTDAESIASQLESIIVGDPPAIAIGEGFNYNVRPTEVVKLSNTQFHAWQNGHFP